MIGLQIVLVALVSFVAGFPVGVAIAVHMNRIPHLTFSEQYLIQLEAAIDWVIDLFR